MPVPKGDTEADRKFREYLAEIKRQGGMPAEALADDDTVRRILAPQGDDDVPDDRPLPKPRPRR